MPTRIRRREPAPFRPYAFQGGTPGERTQHVRNITSLYRQAPDPTLASARDWYPEAHDLAAHFGRGDVSRGAGVISALSPSTKWSSNIEQAAALSGRPIRGVDLTDLQTAGARAARASRAVETAKRIHGEANVPISLREEHEDASYAHARVRERVLGQSPLRMNTTGNVLRAHRIFEGDNPSNVLDMRLKTGHFYQNILDPSNPHYVTVDTHAHDIAHGAKLPYKTERGLDAYGRYGHFADAYQRAAARLGQPASTVQAGTWSHWRTTHGIFD